ncbi:MAG TPA: hypothetical protein VFH61_18660 [Thermoleophilia bacterium]|nr:hypothetical protein [Thermoleophilia bacterium]
MPRYTWPSPPLVQPISIADGANLDAFSRLRVSNPETIFDSKQLWDEQPLFWSSSTIGSGSAAHEPAEAATTLTVTSSAGTIIRQTFQRFNYQPGKSQMVLMTAVPLATGGGTGITASWGPHSTGDGLFFEIADGALGCVVRSSVSGSPVDSRTEQADWNLDTMDGSGPSGITLDMSMTQIALFDFEWLGVGRVRFGWVVDGTPIYCHEANHANTIASVYMSTPNLPLRYSLVNDGTGAASTLVHICSTVIVEGGQNTTGILRYKSTEGTHVDANAANSIYAIVGIKLKATHLDAVVELAEMSMIGQQKNDFEWLLYWNPTVADTFTYSDLTNSCVQAARGATANTISAGTVIGGGLVAGGNSLGGSVSKELRNALRLGSSLTGTPDALVLAARPLTANSDIEGSLSWRELQ